METVKPMVLLGDKTLQWRDPKTEQIVLEAQILHSMSCTTLCKLLDHSKFPVSQLQN